MSTSRLFILALSAVGFVAFVITLGLLLREYRVLTKGARRKYTESRRHAM